MRFKPLLLSVACASALAACTSSTNTNQTTTTTTAPPAQSTTQTTVTTQTAASPQTQAAPQTAVAPGAGTASGNSAAPANAATGQRDACALLTSDEIKAVQGEATKDVKSSQREDGSFAIAQCFYTTPSFTKSISLELTQAKVGGKESPREFWAEHFTRATKEAGERERERERERKQGKDKDKDMDKDRARSEEEEEEGPPPARVTGVGEEAYWVNSRVSGALYVLKGDRFLRISLGGADNDATRQKKARTLAQKALARL